MIPKPALAIVAAGLLAAAPASAAPFPFVLPWDDASPGATDLSALNHKPAGRHGFITARDGHLFAGTERIRFFGVNLCFGGNFPDREAAPRIAARLAKFGINCVRFHHMDMMSTPGGIFAKDGRTLDPERLERLDFFIAQLKERGIYTNLNLHVSRTYPDRPKAAKAGNPDYDKGVDNFSAPLIALQKDFARDLLRHVNPHTGKAYAEEPAVAFVEINNENALLFEWQTGGLDGIAAPYRSELDALWTSWLMKRYGSPRDVAKRWAEGARPAGPEMLKNGSFAMGGDGWVAEAHEGTSNAARFENGIVELTVSGEAREAWHAQLGQSGLRLKAGEIYTVRFRARASDASEIRVSLGRARDDWKILASQPVKIGVEWAEHRAELKVEESEETARLVFGQLARKGPVTFSFADVALHTAEIDGTVPHLDGDQVRSFSKADFVRRTPAAREDWTRFLWELEEEYWPGMYRFLRDELGVRSPIIGTQLTWSPFPIQQKMDVIDSHAYWQHPHFPGRQWDMSHWTVGNLPMAGRPDGGTLKNLAQQRVAGKPYVVTEYNHSAPNEFGAETFPILCAYAALQDWDGVFAFAYSHRGDDWDKQYFASFFDIDQHPVKMATLPAAIALFRRGDLQPARGESIAAISLERAIRDAGRAGPWLRAGQYGIRTEELFLRRIGMRLGDDAAVSPQPGPDNPVWASDTGELLWHTAEGQRRLVIDAPRSKGVVGDGGEFALGSVRMKIESPWAAVHATVIDGADFDSAKRILVTAAASAENTGMQWLNETRTSVGRNWGSAPSLVEGVRGEVSLPTGRRWQAWALDERGRRRDSVPMEGGTLRIDPGHRTLWYEVVVE